MSQTQKVCASEVIRAFNAWIVQQHAHLARQMRLSERRALQLVPLVEAAEARGWESDQASEFANASQNYFLLRARFQVFDDCFLCAAGNECPDELEETSSMRLLWEWYRTEQSGASEHSI